jgi:hypothetical protein
MCELAFSVLCKIKTFCVNFVPRIRDVNWWGGVVVYTGLSHICVSMVCNVIRWSPGKAIILSDKYHLLLLCWPADCINVAHSADHSHVWQEVT